MGCLSHFSFVMDSLVRILIFFFSMGEKMANVVITSRDVLVFSFLFFLIPLITHSPSLFLSGCPLGSVYCRLGWASVLPQCLIQSGCSGSIWGAAPSPLHPITSPPLDLAREFSRLQYPTTDTFLLQGVAGAGVVCQGGTCLQCPGDTGLSFRGGPG